MHTSILPQTTNLQQRPSLLLEALCEVPSHTPRHPRRSRRTIWLLYGCTTVADVNGRMPVLGLVWNEDECAGVPPVSPEHRLPPGQGAQCRDRDHARIVLCGACPGQSASPGQRAMPPLLQSTIPSPHKRDHMHRGLIAMHAVSLPLPHETL